MHLQTSIQSKEQWLCLIIKSHDANASSFTIASLAPLHFPNLHITSIFWKLKPYKFYTLHTLITWNLKSVDALSMLKTPKAPQACAFTGFQKNEGPLVQGHHVCIEEDIPAKVGLLFFLVNYCLSVKVGHTLLYALVHTHPTLVLTPRQWSLGVM